MTVGGGGSRDEIGESLSEALGRAREAAREGEGERGRWGKAVGLRETQNLAGCQERLYQRTMHVRYPYYGHVLVSGSLPEALGGTHVMQGLFL